MSAYKVKLVDLRTITFERSLFHQKFMETVTEEVTVQDLIQDLYSFSGDAPISIRDANGRVFSIAGFEAGSDGVVIVINEE